MANLALKTRTMAAIWALLCLFAIVVFGLGFLAGAHWPEILPGGKTPAREAGSGPGAAGESGAAQDARESAEQELLARELAARIGSVEAGPKLNSKADSGPAPQIEAESKPPAEVAPSKDQESKAEPVREATLDGDEEPAGPPGELVYSVQVASFRSPERAGAMLSELEAKGYSPSVVKIFDNKNKPWYVVQIGEYPSWGKADAVGKNYELGGGGAFNVRALDPKLLNSRKIPHESLTLEIEQ